MHILEPGNQQGKANLHYLDLPGSSQLWGAMARCTQNKLWSTILGQTPEKLDEVEKGMRSCSLKG